MRLRSLVSLVLSFSSFLATSLAKPSTGSSVLIILEPKLQKEEFSQFFNGLEGVGTRILPAAPLLASLMQPYFRTGL
jgi:oligosaccharyltransferase complex subunit beta